METAHGRLYCYMEDYIVTGYMVGSSTRLQTTVPQPSSPWSQSKHKIVHQNLAFEMSLVLYIPIGIWFFFLYSDLVCKLILGLQLGKNYKHRKYISSFISAYLPITKIFKSTAGFQNISFLYVSPYQTSLRFDKHWCEALLEGRKGKVVTDEQGTEQWVRA